MLRNEFERLHAIIKELADTIDTPIPVFILDEDKSLQTKMFIKKKNKQEDEFFPFDEELSYNFYRVLPDLSRFVLNESSGLSITSSESDLDDMNKKL